MITSFKLFEKKDKKIEIVGYPESNIIRLTVHKYTNKKYKVNDYIVRKYFNMVNNKLIEYYTVGQILN